MSNTIHELLFRSMKKRQLTVSTKLPEIVFKFHQVSVLSHIVWGMSCNVFEEDVAHQLNVYKTT